MITSAVPLNDGSGQYAFKSYSLCFEPSARLVHKLAALPMASTKPKSHLTIPMRDSEPFHAATPIPDILDDDGKGTHCSLHSVVNAARCGDYGFAQDMAPVMKKPDAKLRGVPAWKVGDSANEATSLLATAWKARQETLQDNRKIQTGHRL
jgi:hypothetical protein